MPLQTRNYVQTDDETQYELVFRMDNVKNIYHLLKAINFHPVITMKSCHETVCH